MARQELGRSSMHRAQFELSSLSSGIYFVRLSTEQGTVTRKLFVQ